MTEVVNINSLTGHPIGLGNAAARGLALKWHKLELWIHDYRYKSSWYHRDLLNQLLVRFTVLFGTSLGFSVAAAGFIQMVARAIGSSISFGWLLLV